MYRPSLIEPANHSLRQWEGGVTVLRDYQSEIIDHFDRLVARAVLMIAQDPESPQWDASNKRADRYRKAREASLAK